MPANHQRINDGGLTERFDKMDVQLDERGWQTDASQALLLLNALAYNLAHTARVLMEMATQEGWSLKRLRERVLRVAGRLLLHGRRATLVLSPSSAKLWTALLSQLRRLHYAGT